MKQMREEVGRLLLEKGRGLRDRGSLLKVFWKMEKQAKQQKEEAEEGLKMASYLQKRKLMKVQEKAERERQKWLKWAMWWQGISHMMTKKTT